MRPLKSHKRKKITSHKNNRISTEKVSFITQNKNFLTELWQLLFFTSTSTFLILTFLNQAWKPISFDQTKITGLSGITKNITLRNKVAVISNNIEDNCDLNIISEEIEFKKTLTGLSNPVTQIASGKLIIDGSSTEFLNFLTKFR